MLDKRAGASPGKLFRGVGLGLLVALTGLIVAGLPFGREWEEDLGLTWLFRLRGPVPPPDDVAVLSIDRESADRLGLPDNPRKWPRDLHARLLDRLKDLGASVVVFDVQFQEPRDPKADLAFADSVHRAGNVVLFEFLNKEILPMVPGDDGDANAVVIEQRVPPVRELADAALGLAPFALPVIPRKVSEVWIFKPEAGEAATLPVVALCAHGRDAFARIPALIADLEPAAQGRLAGIRTEMERHVRIDEKVEMLRQIFLEDPSLAPRLLQRLDGAETAGVENRRYLSALVAALGGPGSMYLNYYGPPRTIETISYHQVLTGEAAGAPNIAGRAILVGAAPRSQPAQRDGFYTPYTLRSGLDIGGVEIAATAFANLLDQDAIVPLPPGWEAVLIALWGLGLGVGLRRRGGGWIPLAAAGAGVAYFGVAWLAFSRLNLWLPLVTPLFAQLLPATFAALLLRYRGVHRERENIRRAFGMHLPPRVVDKLARGIDDLTASTEHAFGICLATDAEQYTALSERLEPDTLKQFMNSYYAVLFPPVRKRGGVIADVIGDSMLAIWAADSDRPALRKDACDAALEILAAVDAFNERDPDHRLPTRIGLHCGELVLGHVGAVDHYEYRAVGDIVNTSSRIEGLCKRLGTSLLVSNAVVSDLQHLQIRPLGRFLLKGKTRPLDLAELAPPRLEDNRRGRLWERFAEALDAFRKGDLSRALGCFERIEEELGDDGPTAFYRQLCRQYLADPSAEEWTGIVRLTKK